MKFVTLEETNDHEGETWCFYLQLEGNEDAIAGLQKLIEQHAMGEDFEIDMEEIPESDVDVLVKRGGGGYMRYHNKVTGDFDLGSLESRIDRNGDADSQWNDANRALYKGGIRDFFS